MIFEWDEDKNTINNKSIRFLLKQRFMYLMTLIILKYMILSIAVMRTGILQ